MLTYSFLNVRADHESTSVFIHRFNNLMSKAQMSDDFTGTHVRQLLTSFVFLQYIPTHLHSFDEEPGVCCAEG